LFVEDHARALVLVSTTGKIAETYNIGGHNEKQSIDVVNTICEILDELVGLKSDLQDNMDKVGRASARQQSPKSYKDLISFVKDRPGHDIRYTIDASKIAKELNWIPQETFDSGIRKTVQWYLDNQDWCQHVQDSSYQR